MIYRHATLGSDREVVMIGLEVVSVYMFLLLGKVKKNNKIKYNKNGAIAN